MTDLAIEKNEACLEIALTRSHRRNAITLAMYDGLTEALVQASADSSVRAVLVYGADGTFTSGNDLMDFMQNPPTGEDSPVAKFLRALARFDKPLVAAVDGPAIGVGTTMLLHCDLVYASEGARFQLPFVNLALVPEAGSSLLLPNLVGRQKAAELLMFGDAFDAEEARRYGLVNEIVASAALLSHVRDKVKVLTEKPAEALRLIKSLLRSRNARNLEETMTEEARLFIERLGSAEVREAITAFFEKRKPNFRSIA